MCLTVYLNMILVTIITVKLVSCLNSKLTLSVCMCVVWALNAIRWCVREYTRTRIGRSTCLMRTRKTLGRPTTPVRSGFTSEGVRSRNETLQQEEILHSGSLAEGYDYRNDL